MYKTTYIFLSLNSLSKTRERHKIKLYNSFSEKLPQTWEWLAPNELDQMII